MGGASMKTYLWKLIGALVTMALTCAAASATPAKRYDDTTKTCRTLTPSNDLQGYKIFRKFCKSCHNLTSEEGKFLYNESKMSKAWNRVFAEKYPKCAKDGSWAKLSLEDQLKLNDYLFRTGSGSYDPHDAKDCG